MGTLRMEEVEATPSAFMKPEIVSHDSSTWPMVLTLGPGIHRVLLSSVGKTLSITTDDGVFTGYERVAVLAHGGGVTLNASPAVGSVSVSVQSLGHG